MYKRWQNFSQFSYLQLIYLVILWVEIRTRMLHWRLGYRIAESFSSSFVIYFLCFCLQKVMWPWIWCARDERESVSLKPITFLGVQGRVLFPKTLAFLFFIFHFFPPTFFFWTSLRSIITKATFGQIVSLDLSTWFFWTRTNFFSTALFTRLLRSSFRDDLMKISG